MWKERTMSIMRRHVLDGVDGTTLSAGRGTPGRTPVCRHASAER